MAEISNKQKIDAILELAKGLDIKDYIALVDHLNQLALQKLAQRLETRPDICKD